MLYPRWIFFTMLFYVGFVCYRMADHLISGSWYALSAAAQMSLITGLVSGTVASSVALGVTLNARRRVRGEIARKQQNLIMASMGVPELDHHGLRVKQDWSFVAEMEHELGYTHTSESQAACRHADCATIITELTSEEVRERTDKKILEALKDAVDAGHSWEEECKRQEMKERLQKDDFGRYIDYVENQMIRAAGLTVNEARERGYPREIIVDGMNYGEYFSHLRDMGHGYRDATNLVNRIFSGREQTGERPRDAIQLGRGVGPLRPTGSDFDTILS